LQVYSDLFSHNYDLMKPHVKEI